MPNGLEQIIVEYKLDVTTLKQQFENIKTEMQGLKTHAETTAREGSEHIKNQYGKGADGARDSFKKLGTELKQIVALTQTGEAVKQLQNLDKAAAASEKQVGKLTKELEKNEGKLMKAGDSATALAGKIETAKEKIAKWEANLKDLAERGKQNIGEFKRFEKQVERQRAAINRYEKSMATLNQTSGELNTKIAETNTKLNETKSATTGLQVLQSTSHLVKGLAGGFELCTSSLHLLGVENKTVNTAFEAMQQGMKVARVAAEIYASGQAASAAITNIHTIATGANTAATGTQTGATKLQTLAQKASTLATTIATGATEAFNVVLRANPIGLIITALAGLIAVIGYFISKTSSATDEQKKLNDAQKAAMDISKAKTEAIKKEAEAEIERASKRVESLRNEGASAKDLKEAEDNLTQAREEGAKKQLEALGTSAEGFKDYKEKYIKDEKDLQAKLQEARSLGNKNEELSLQLSLTALKDNYKEKEDAFQHYQDIIKGKEEKQKADMAEAQKEELEAEIAHLDLKIAKHEEHDQEEIDLKKKRMLAQAALDKLGLQENSAKADRSELIDIKAKVAAQEAQDDFDKEREEKKKLLAVIDSIQITTRTSPTPAATDETAMEKVSVSTAEQMKELGVDPAKEAADKAAAEITKTLTTIQKKTQETITILSSVTGTIFKTAQQSLSNQFTIAQEELNSWQQKAMARAEGNSRQQAAIQRVYHAQQLQMAREKAMKEAEIKRLEAEYDKAQSLVKIAINTAVSVSKVSAEPAQMALAIATGAAEAAAVAAQPLPPIPKFATGVVGFQGKGSETSDSNPVYISHNESIITAAATKKYGAELEAINQMRFENLLLEKYLLPALGNTPISTSANYDDWLLRKEIREGNHLNQKSLQYLQSIAGSLKVTAQNRYHA